MTSTAVLVAAFVVLAGVSIGSSSVLVTRIERLGERIGVTEAILGLAAAVAADAPEITSAATALLRGQRDVSVAVVLGANVFQLASLLGVGAIVAGGIALTRRVVAFESVAAVWIALIAFSVVSRGAAPAPALLLALVVFVPYVVISAMSPAARARIGSRWIRRDVVDVIAQEEQDLSQAIGHLEQRRSDAPVALFALLSVVLASAALEGVATEISARWNVSDVVLGGVILAGVTSLPNLVAAIHLARRGRGSATLSEAMNSNRVNTIAGLLIPAALIGATEASTGSAINLLAACYVLMTIAVLFIAYLRSGISRAVGTAILATYGLIVFALIFGSS